MQSSSPTRLGAVAGGLLFAGALFGGVAGALSALVALSITEGPPPELASMSALGFPAAVGAALGALLLPAASLLLLRRVPLGVSWLGTTVGTMIGGAAGWVGATALKEFPVAWATGGALIGFFAAVLVLRARFGRGEAPGPAARVAV